MGSTVNSIIFLLYRKDFTGLRTFLRDILIKENNSWFSNFDENYSFLHVTLEDYQRELYAVYLHMVTQDTLEINNLISIINSLETENISLKQVMDTDPLQPIISGPNQFNLSTIERTIYEVQQRNDIYPSYQQPDAEDPSLKPKRSEVDLPDTIYIFTKILISLLQQCILMILTSLLNFEKDSNSLRI